MLEKHMRKTVVALLKKRHAIAVENGMTHPGTPDVRCTLGWAEMKTVDAWPARPDTVVRLNHELTPQQRIFAIKELAAGGVSLVIVTVGDNEWLVFNGGVAAEHLERVNRETLCRLALRHWQRIPTTEELEGCFLQRT